MFQKLKNRIMKKIYNPQPETWSEICKRPTQTFSDVEDTVKQIFKEVQRKGDKAIAKYSSFFDGVALEKILVTSVEIEIAKKEVSSELKEAIQLAKSNIEQFHAAQKKQVVKKLYCVRHLIKTEKLMPPFCMQLICAVLLESIK